MAVIGIHHIALNVKDLAEAEHFYVDLLGFTKIPTRPDFGIGGAWFQAGANQVHIVVDPDCQIDRRQHFALQVDEFDNVMSALEAHGVKVFRLDPIPGAGRQAFINDPSGNLIEFNQPENSTR